MNTKPIDAMDLIRAARRVPGYIFCRELTKATPGIDWTGCGKNYAASKALDLDPYQSNRWLHQDAARKLVEKLLWIQARIDRGMRPADAANEHYKD